MPACPALSDQLPGTVPAVALEIDVQTGPDALGRAWDALVAGNADPRKGSVFSL